MIIGERHDGAIMKDKDQSRSVPFFAMIIGMSENESENEMDDEGVSRCQGMRSDEEVLTWLRSRARRYQERGDEHQRQGSHRAAERLYVRASVCDWLTMEYESAVERGRPLVEEGDRD